MIFQVGCMNTRRVMKRTTIVIWLGIAIGGMAAPLSSQQSRLSTESDAAVVAAILYARPKPPRDTLMIDTASHGGAALHLAEIAQRVGAHVGRLDAALTCGSTPDTCRLAEQRVLAIDSVVVSGGRATVVLRFLSQEKSTWQPVGLLIRTLFLAKRRGTWRVVGEGRVSVSSTMPISPCGSNSGGLTIAEADKGSFL